MESELRVSARPELSRPVLVAAFRGWNDGAQAASLAAGYLAKLWGAEQIADVDPLLGIEPNVRWRAFTELVVGHAQELGVELVVTLGALLADVPHTRPSPVTGSASDENLVKELGLSTSRYEGPTGIVGVLHDACNKAGIPSA